MAELRRVKSKDTGHEYTTAAYDPDAHTLLRKDAVDAGGSILPPVVNTNVGGESAPEPEGDKE